MNQTPIIKLKDTDIIKIYTDVDSYIVKEYSSEWTETIAKVEFTFSNGNIFIAEIEDISVNAFVYFFYGKDYSNIEYQEFCDEFIENFYIKTDNTPHRGNKYCVHARICGTSPIDHVYQYMVEIIEGKKNRYFKEYIAS